MALWDHGKHFEYPGTKTKFTEVCLQFHAAISRNFPELFVDFIYFLLFQVLFQTRLELKNWQPNNLMLRKKNKAQPIKVNPQYLVEDEEIKPEGREEANHWEK